MNNNTKREEQGQDNSEDDQKQEATTTPVSASSSSSSPPSRGISRVSITSNGNGANSSLNTASSSLMSGNGELLVRRSPVLNSNLINNNNNINATNNISNSKGYYTLGSPSISNSYISEDVSDVLNSSYEDFANNASHLNEKVDLLQKQVETLSETQASQDERFKRTRLENDDLLNRIHCLEDQLRELEINSDNRAREDERRFKETMAKQMKVKSQECEQHLNANYLLQQDIITLQKDLMKSEAQLRSIKLEKEKIEAELSEKNGELSQLDEEVHKLKLIVKNLKDEESVKSNLINILNDELEDNHNRSQQSHIPTSNNNQSTLSSDVLESDLSRLRDENKQLKEANEELQAQLLNVQLEEGRSLIQEGNKSYSLADEMGDIDVHKLMEALKEQQDDNARLRKYMDDILLKIVEKNPEILEK